MKIEIIKGTAGDIDELESLYDNLNDHLASGINYPCWKKGVYPAREDAEAGVAEDSLYVAKSGGVIVGSVILNHIPETGYDGVTWGANTDDYSRIYVIRTLVVNHEYQHCGIAQELLEFTAKLARAEGAVAVRLDVYETNTPAIRLYEKMGYKYIATVDLGLAKYGLDNFKLYELVI